jgi:hypothetical protein
MLKCATHSSGTLKPLTQFRTDTVQMQDHEETSISETAPLEMNKYAPLLACEVHGLAYPMHHTQMREKHACVRAVWHRLAVGGRPRGT